MIKIKGNNEWESTITLSGRFQDWKNNGVKYWHNRLKTAIANGFQKSLYVNQF